MVRIAILKQHNFSQSDPVLIRQFSKKLQSDPVLIWPNLASVLIPSDLVLSVLIFALLLRLNFMLRYEPRIY